MIYERLNDQYFQRWKGSLDSTTGKLRTYKLFKEELKFEDYLYLPPKLRLPLTKFRVSAHQLRIEIGRYHRPRPLPVEERICLHCDSGEVEDEFHFLVNCQLYKSIREQLIKRCVDINGCFHHLAREEKLRIIMKQLDPSTLANYVRCAFKIRNSEN